MVTLQVHLLGKFEAQCNAQLISGLTAHRAQELFCYLLLHRDRPHPREILADRLWGDSGTTQPKKALRQALWQVQTALDGMDPASQHRLLLVEADWVQLNTTANLWLDVAAIEETFEPVRRVPGAHLSPNASQALQLAVELYQGDLLEGWYQDWCLIQRERFQNLYLAILDKLMSYCEVQREYASGVHYGGLILDCDRARERTHRHLMRLHYLTGDRTAALRQYERCVAVLQAELGVGPARLTVALCEQIRADRLADQEPAGAEPAPASGSQAALTQLLNRLHQLQTMLEQAQQQLGQNIRAAEQALKDRS